MAWLASLGYRVRYGPELEDEQPGDEAVVLETQLREALDRLNQKTTRGRSRRRVPQAAERRGGYARRAQPARPPDARRRGERRIQHGRTARSPSHVHADRLRRPDRDNEWLAVNQVHRRREPARAPPRHRRLRQRPAARGRRAEERGRRERDSGRRFNQLQTYKKEIPSSSHQRGARHLRWRPGARRHLGAARSGSYPGAPSRGEETRRRRCPNSKCCSRACSRSAVSSTATDFVVFEDEAAASSSRSWPATTSSMPSTSRSRRPACARLARQIGDGLAGGDPGDGAWASSGTPRAPARA